MPIYIKVYISYFVKNKIYKIGAYFRSQANREYFGNMTKFISEKEAVKRLCYIKAIGLQASRHLDRGDCVCGDTRKNS